MIRTGGYRKGVGRYEIESILRAVDKDKYKTGG